MTLVIAVGILIGLVILTVGTALFDRVRSRRQTKKVQKAVARRYAFVENRGGK